jgi:hypothetical protein
MYEPCEGNNTFVYREDTLIQSPMTCASSSGANSIFPATIWCIQKVKMYSDRNIEFRV